ncbi:hypothetical protein EYZ11_004493 [Aspergillus tanneri]|uniref:Uncharacterized protein n=1 Tax=Aspergillus tanneri TaxID=1220188 RepID=A0A4S3JKQ0_9EURO|nr:hypothetical protein EYZ11_004493 [Aspergillus tanneri]
MRALNEGIKESSKIK